MASSYEFVEYVLEQLSLAGNISYKKMFGEYAVYCDNLCFALICDDQLFINPTNAAIELLPEPTMGIPYQDYLL